MVSALRPPPGLHCPHELNCPSIEGWNAVSLKRNYLSQERDLAKARQSLSEQGDALRRALERCEQLEREKADLQAKIRILHQRQFKANRKKPEETENEKQQAAAVRKRGAPKGHPVWSRKRPATFNRSVQVGAPSSCPYCHSSNLREVEGLREHWQEDIVLIPRVVATRFLHRRARCGKCGKTVIRWHKDQAGAGPVGPVAKSLAAYLRDGIGLSVRKTQTLFRDLFGFPFVPASVFGFERAGAKLGRPLYEDLLEKIRNSALVHADETHWRQDGVNHYLWFGGNRDLAYYRMDRHRTSEAAQALLGKDFQGGLVTDGYAAYNSVGAKMWQSCLSHLIRHAKESGEEIQQLPEEQRDAPSALFCEKAKQLFQKACQVCAEFESGKRDWHREAGGVLKEFERTLDLLCATPLAHKKSESFRNRLLGPERPKWFAFLRHPGLPATNNLAERAMRPMVLRRKTSFGTRSPAGSTNLCVLTSLIQTAKLQDRDPLRFLQTLFTQDATAAQAALYHDSS